MINALIKYNIKNKIKGNEIMLYRAFYNVIENAIKYNKINGTVNILCSEDYNIIKVKIIDTGKGIKEEEVKKFLNLFIDVKELIHIQIMELD